jgi:TIR domain-containing protein
MNGQPKNVQWDGIPRIIHLLADSEDSVTRASAVVDSAGNLSQRNIVIDNQNTGSSTTGLTNFLQLDGCAAVLLFSRASLGSPLFAHVVDLVLRESLAREDFRAFLAFEDLTRAEFDDNARSGNSICERLMENIQITEGLSLEEIKEPLADYLRTLRDVQDKGTWRASSTSAGLFVARVATLLQLASVLILLAGWLGLSAGLQSRLIIDSNEVRRALSLSAGVVIFWCQTLPMFFVLRGFQAQAASWRLDWIAPRFLACFAISIAASGIAKHFGASNGWLWLGFALGVCIDSVRRTGPKTQRIRWALSPDSYGPVSPEFNAKTSYITKANLFRLTLWPTPQQSVVISYARSSQWSSNLANELHAALELAGVSVFLDRKANPIGANWRRLLRQEIGLATTFICILDDKAISRPWVAAEFYNAVRGQNLTGLPHVIVLEPLNLNYHLAMPVFHQSLGNATPQTSLSVSPRRIVVSHRTVEVIASELKRSSEPLTVVPGRVAMYLDGILVPVTSVGGFAGVLGLLAWLTWGYEMWNGFPIIRSINPLIAYGLFLLVGYLAGFASHLVIISRYQIRHEYPPDLAGTQMFSAIGLALLLLAWHTKVSPLIQGWEIVACFFGWWRAGLFVRYAALVKREFIRA